VSRSQVADQAVESDHLAPDRADEVFLLVVTEGIPLLLEELREALDHRDRCSQVM
jgi:hypothetical protein